MATAEHLALIHALESTSERSWGDEALLACLVRLASGGPTEGHRVEVEDAGAIEDGFLVIYVSPWGPRVGFRVTIASTNGDGPIHYAHVYTSGDSPTPQEFGEEIADFAIGEPLGTSADSLGYDVTGLGWWGEDSPPTPWAPRRPVTDRRLTRPRDARNVDDVHIEEIP